MKPVVWKVFQLFRISQRNNYPLFSHWERGKKGTFVNPTAREKSWKTWLYTKYAHTRELCHVLQATQYPPKSLTARNGASHSNQSFFQVSSLAAQQLTYTTPGNPIPLSPRRATTDFSGSIPGILLLPHRWQGEYGSMPSKITLKTKTTQNRTTMWLIILIACSRSKISLHIFKYI